MPQDIPPGDQPIPPPPPPGAEPPAAAPVVPGVPPLSEQEIRGGKAMAVLSYAINFVGLPFWAVPLVMRDNDFALFHAKQALMVWLLGVGLMALNTLLTLIPVVGCITLILWPASVIFVVVVNLIGLVNAAKGRVERLPFVGDPGVRWFEGVRKA